MDRLNRTILADILLSAPAWERVGLTVRDERTRLRAADAFAATIIERLEEPPIQDADQLRLPIGGF